MKRDTIIVVTLVAVSITAFAFSKKVNDQMAFNVAKREDPGAWKADVERVLSKVNDSMISGVERKEYRKMQYKFYDIVSNYNK